MKITDQTFLDYLDKVLTEEEIRHFEEYLSKNIHAQLKLKEFKKIDQKIDKAFKDPKISEFRIPEELSKDYNELLDNLDQYKKKNFENLGENLSLRPSVRLSKKPDQSFFREISQSIDSDSKDFKDEGFFKRNFNWLFPTQSLAFGLLVLAYIFLPINMATQVVENKNKEDLLVQLANFNHIQEFLLTSEYEDLKAVRLNNQTFNLKDITKNLKLRSASQASPYDCDNNLDSKIIEIFPPDNPLDKDILTYCGDKDKNNWILLNIEISKDKKPSNLSDKFKTLLEKDSLYLFPQD